MKSKQKRKRTKSARVLIGLRRSDTSRYEEVRAKLFDEKIEMAKESLRRF